MEIYIKAYRWIFPKMPSEVFYECSKDLELFERLCREDIMTEKRFTVPDRYQFSHSKVQLNGEPLTNDEIVRLLNVNDMAFVENLNLKKENKELKKQLRREETDKKRLMSYLMRYKGFGFDEIVEDFLDEPYYDNWWENGFYEFCWDEYLKEKRSCLNDL